VGFYTEIGTGTATIPAKIHGFVMDKWGVFTQVDVPGAVDTVIRGNNPRGDLVGTYRDEYGTHGFLMRRDDDEGGHREPGESDEREDDEGGHRELRESDR